MTLDGGPEGGEAEAEGPGEPPDARLAGPGAFDQAPLGRLAELAPIALASRFRWFVRIGLAGYALTAIVAWAMMGPYYSTAYVAKGIEIALIALLIVDFVRFDGNPFAKVRAEIAGAIGYVQARPATAPSAA